ncbi:MAG: hypothetical protein KJN63_08750, partial [Acidimicrobiia bacterium]|nr:hypothetical protein [Acidimicrobiia bacterium]
SAVRHFAPSFLTGFSETSSAPVGPLAAHCFAAVQEATDALVAKTWTLAGGNAPPTPVPLRLT